MNLPLTLALMLWMAPGGLPPDWYSSEIVVRHALMTRITSAILLRTV
jgi:hypothetical protein